jgi:hypothetical protein
MSEIIWAAIIAGGVSVVGNAVTAFVAWQGRKAQDKAVDTTTRVELKKLEAENVRLVDAKREQARDQRRGVYEACLTALIKFDQLAMVDALDPEQAMKVLDELHTTLSAVLLAGTKEVQTAIGLSIRQVGSLATALQQGEYDGLKAAYNAHKDGLMEARAKLMVAMRAARAAFVSSRGWV